MIKLTLTKVRLWALFLCCCASQLAAQELRLVQPIDCVLGADCYIQHFVDRDPDPGTLDYQCGKVTYDGHKGTDFALASLEALSAGPNRGVNVLAAADGRVRATRDEMADVSVDDPNAPDLAGQDCGNGVVLTHPGGWESQYCHLRRGTVLVREGQSVTAGEPLGQVGLSGKTSFPHLHFTLRHKGTVIDPFQPKSDMACGAADPLWTTSIAYRAGGIVSVGALDRVPEFEAVESGLPIDGVSDSTQPLVLWAYIYAAQVGDIVTMVATDPQNTRTLETEFVIKRAQPQLFRAYGRKAPREGWSPGKHRATVTLIRDHKALDSRTFEVTLP